MVASTMMFFLVAMIVLSVVAVILIGLLVYVQIVDRKDAALRAIVIPYAFARIAETKTVKGKGL